MVARFDAVSLFIFVLILWTLQPHFTWWLNAQTSVLVWGRVMLQQPRPRLDSVSYAGSSVVPSVTD